MSRQQEVQRVLQDQVFGDLSIKGVFTQSREGQVSVHLAETHTGEDVPETEDCSRGHSGLLPGGQQV